MGLWQTGRCGRCGIEGRFLGLSKHGICASCQTNLKAEIESLMRELPQLERKFQQLKTPAKRQIAAREIVSRLERVMAIEQIGIYSDKDTDVLLPSQWLSQYRNEHDWAAVDSVSNRFDAIWEDLYHRPKAPTTVRKLQAVRALAEETRKLMFDPEHIVALDQRITEKLNEVTP